MQGWPLGGQRGLGGVTARAGGRQLRPNAPGRRQRSRLLTLQTPKRLPQHRRAMGGRAQDWDRGVPVLAGAGTWGDLRIGAIHHQLPKPARVHAPGPPPGSRAPTAALSPMAGTRSLPTEDPANAVVLAHSSPHRHFLPLPAAVLTFLASRTSQPALIALQNRFHRQTLLPLGSRGLPARTGTAGLSSPSSSGGQMPGTDQHRGEQCG